MLIFSQIYSQDTGWKKSVELSYVNTSGNTQTETLSGKLSAEYPEGKTRFFSHLSYLFSKNSGDVSANRLDTGLRLERVLFNRLFVYTAVTYEKDKFSGYDYRFSFGPGIGWDIAKSEKHILKAMASFLYFFDGYALPGDPTDDYGTASAGLEYQWKISENVDFETKAAYMASLKESEKYFITGESALKVAINSALAIGISYHIKHQNLVPAPNIKKTDTTFLTSLIVNL
jgi:putative salt-induced outer membrane protein